MVSPKAPRVISRQCAWVFAKKAQSINLDGDQYTTTVYSFTKQKEFPSSCPRGISTRATKASALDDFANGKPLKGLIICAMMPGATVEGIGIAVRRVSRAAAMSRSGAATLIPWHRGADGSGNRYHRIRPDRRISRARIRNHYNSLLITA